MAEETQNILDQAKTQEAAWLPRLKDQPLLDYGYRFIQNLLNKIAIDKYNLGFGSVKPFYDESLVSDNPYLKDVKRIINSVIEKFHKQRVTNSDVARYENGKYKDYVLKNSGIDVPEDIELENISDANGARHMFTNYPELTLLFEDFMKKQFGHGRNFDRRFLASYAPGEYNNGYELNKRWVFGLKDREGRWANPYEILRKEVAQKMIGMFPSYEKAMNTPVDINAKSLQNVLGPDQIEYPPMVYNGKMYGHPLMFLYNNPNFSDFKLKEKYHILPDDLLEIMSQNNVFDATNPANIPGFLQWLTYAQRNPVGRRKVEEKEEPVKEWKSRDVDSEGNGHLRGTINLSKFRR